MNNFYDNRRQAVEQSLDLLKETTKISFNFSVGVLEKQMQFFNEAAARQIDNAFAAQAAATPEAALALQKRLAAEEAKELRKIGDACQKMTDDARREFVAVAEKGRVFAEAAADEATKQAAAVFPGSNGAAVSSMALGAVKSFGDLCQKNAETAASAFNAGVKTAMQQGQAVAGKRANGATVPAAAVVAAKGKKRGRPAARKQ